MIKEKIYLVFCKNCKMKQEKIVRAEKPYGKVRECVYCHRRWTLNRENVLKRVK
jgi:hypothetical protein